MRINRYIMECKLTTFFNIYRFGFIELIDTLWNVNNISNLIQLICSKELIDTLWNVNIMDGKYFSVIKKELIDTLWNVNEGTLNAICCQSRN